MEKKDGMIHQKKISNMIITYQQFIKEGFNVGEIPISNMSKYLSRMTKGFDDKIFFINKINLDVLIDFGCADGQMLNYLSHAKPNMKLIGYDLDTNMIKISRAKYPNMFFSDNWQEILDEVNSEKYKGLIKGLLLSSIIHEVYSYSILENKNKFWKNVFNDAFTYIIIRDMMTQDSYKKPNLELAEKVRNKSISSDLSDFEKIWGSIDNSYKNLMHWLLKYTYTDNWDREINENYLPYTLEHLKRRRIPNGWTILYANHYLLPYLKQKVKEDYDITLTQPTHLKMIIENNNYLGKHL